VTYPYASRDGPSTIEFFEQLFQLGRLRAALALTITGSSIGPLHVLRSDVLARPNELGWGNLIAKRGLKTVISFFGCASACSASSTTGVLRIRWADKSGDLEWKMPKSKIHLNAAAFEGVRDAVISLPSSNILGSGLESRCRGLRRGTGIGEGGSGCRED
jgi:hypothetical protein